MCGGRGGEVGLLFLLCIIHNRTFPLTLVQSSYLSTSYWERVVLYDYTWIIAQVSPILPKILIFGVLLAKAQNIP